MQNFMELEMKKFSDPKAMTCGIWGIKTSLGQFGPKSFGKGDVSYRKSGTLLSISKNRTSFSPESCNESNEIMKS